MSNLPETTVVERKFEASFLLESIAFGMTDGVICLLGIIVGVARATSDPAAVIIATIVGGIADALGNSIGFFVSQSTERAVQIREANGEENNHIHSKKEVWLSGLSSFLATILILTLLIFPFFLTSVWTATAISFVIGTISAFTLGTYVGRLDSNRPYKSGIRYALITIAGATISYGVGELLNIWLY